jgi:TonB family protein
MHEILQQENGSLPMFGSARLSGWQQESFPTASEDSQTMKISPIILALALVVLLPFTVSAQASQNGGLSSAEVDRIVQAFIAKEIQFRRALNQYSFKRDVLVQKVGMGGQVTGEYHRVSNFTFDDQGNRYEKITFFPMSTMPEITQADIDQMGGINPFALEPNKINEYTFRYVGKEKIDELNLYVFEVTPKVIPNPKKTQEKLFSGRIWVDDQDLQIVKTKGKGVPETKDNKFPTVETYREHIDGRYWFPTFSYADEELIFENGGSIHVRMKVRYSDFTFTEATLKVVTEIGEADETPGKGVAKPLEVGALNSKAISLPKPVYPEEARRIRSSGRVTVRVVVDETGKVISAQATDGPPPLRETAEAAARLAKFEPTIKDGITVKITGTLTYDF